MIKVNHELYAAAQCAVASGRWRVDPEQGLLHGNKDALLGSPNTSGYLKVTLRHNGHILGVLAHRVVWEALRGRIPDGMFINHIDGVKTNNAIDNLELVTHQQNMDHAHAIGLMPAVPRMQSDQTIRAIYIAAWAGDEKRREIAARFGVTISYVNSIKYQRHCAAITRDVPVEKRDQRIKRAS